MNQRYYENGFQAVRGTMLTGLQVKLIFRGLVAFASALRRGTSLWWIKQARC